MHVLMRAGPTGPQASFSQGAAVVARPGSDVFSISLAEMPAKRGEGACLRRRTGARCVEGSTELELVTVEWAEGSSFSCTTRCRLDIWMRERRQFAAPDELTAALEALDLRPRRLRAAGWPGELTTLTEAGLYSWWVDEGGAAALSAGVGVVIPAGRIYAGQTGATRWPSGTIVSSTLSGRIGGNHLAGTIRASTFRRTLAAILIEPLALIVTGPARVDPSSEKCLSEWMRAHLEVAVHPFVERDVLSDLEDKVLAKLDPPLNIEGMRASPIRTRVARLRGILTSRGAAAPVTLAQASPTPRSSGETGRAAARAGEHRSEFTRAEIAKLTQLVADLRRAERGRQNTIRASMRRIGFYITDYLPDQSGFSRSDLDDLIERGAITVVD
jgi:hypothetical protein